MQLLTVRIKTLPQDVFAQVCQKNSSDRDNLFGQYRWALLKRLILRLRLYWVIFFFFELPPGVGNAGGWGADNIKPPVGPCQTLLPYCPLSISQWINSGFLNTFNVPALGIWQLAKLSPQEVTGIIVLGSHCNQWVYFLSQVCWCRNKAENDSSWVRFSESFQVNLVNTVTENSVPAFSYSKHRFVLFIWCKTEQKHSLIKSRENIVPKSLYILAHNTFIFFQANGMQLVSNSKKDNGKKCLQ